MKDCSTTNHAVLYQPHLSAAICEALVDGQQGAMRHSFAVHLRHAGLKQQVALATMKCKKATQRTMAKPTPACIAESAVALVPCTDGTTLSKAPSSMCHTHTLASSTPHNSLPSRLHARNSAGLHSAEETVSGAATCVAHYAW